MSYWRTGASAVFELLQSLLQLRTVLDELHSSKEDLSRAIVATATFCRIEDDEAHQDDGDWTTPLSLSLSKSILERLLGRDCPFSRISIIEHILLSYIKPLFLSNPHPSVHPGTGRKLARPRGGDLFVDHFGSAAWKGNAHVEQAGNRSTGAIGCWRVYQYLLGILEKNELEQIWHLLVPPLMAMLDDHEVRYRKEGIESLRIFLEKADARLLKKTGLDELVQKVCRAAIFERVHS